MFTQSPAINTVGKSSIYKQKNTAESEQVFAGKYNRKWGTLEVDPKKIKFTNNKDTGYQVSGSTRLLLNRKLSHDTGMNMTDSAYTKPATYQENNKGLKFKQISYDVESNLNTDKYPSSSRSLHLEDVLKLPGDKRRKIAYYKKKAKENVVPSRKSQVDRLTNDNEDLQNLSIPELGSKAINGNEKALNEIEKRNFSSGSFTEFFEKEYLRTTPSTNVQKEAEAHAESANVDLQEVKASENANMPEDIVKKNKLNVEKEAAEEAIDDDGKKKSLNEDETLFNDVASGEKIEESTVESALYRYVSEKGGVPPEKIGNVPNATTTKDQLSVISEALTVFTVSTIATVLEKEGSPEYKFVKAGAYVPLHMVIKTIEDAADNLMSNFSSFDNYQKDILSQIISTTIVSLGVAAFMSKSKAMKFSHAIFQTAVPYLLSLGVNMVTTYLDPYMTQNMKPIAPYIQPVTQGLAMSFLYGHGPLGKSMRDWMRKNTLLNYTPLKKNPSPDSSRTPASPDSFQTPRRRNSF